MNVRLLVAYEGTQYHGWQIQPDDRTVEGELTRALARILNRPADELKVQGASRTDSGVHALGQVAHFQHDSDRSLWDFVRGLNALTDDDICVVRVDEADPDFHARHSARGKIYRYKIWNHRFPHPLERRHAWHMPLTVDVGLMKEAASKMVGHRDFEGFRASDCDAPTTDRKMRRVEVHTDPDRPLITVEVEGTAFLKHMVRIMVGTLVDIGTGRLTLDTMDEIFETGDRRLGGITAPSCGLTLVEIFYPDFPWDGGTPEIGGPWLAPAETLKESKGD